MRTILVCLFFFTLSGCARTLPPKPVLNEPSNLRKAITGNWAWDVANCEKSPQLYSFDRDGSKMYVDSEEGLVLGNRNKIMNRVTYKIIGEAGNVLRTAIEGEDRFIAIDKTAEWDLVLMNANQFCWRRTDWHPEGCTKPVNRCEESS